MPKLAIFYYGFIVIIAILSLMVGLFGGLEQRKLKTLLAYSSISHMGYFLIAFNSGTSERLQMLISYLLIYTLSGLCVWSIFVLTRLKNFHSKKQNKDLTDIVSLSKAKKNVSDIFFNLFIAYRRISCYDCIFSKNRFIFNCY